MADRWLSTFAERAVLDHLRDAAEACMADAGDGCPPETCRHDANRMTPLEFAEWVELQLVRRRRPVRIDHHENRAAGQRRRLEILQSP